MARQIGTYVISCVAILQVLALLPPSLGKSRQSRSMLDLDLEVADPAHSSLSRILPAIGWNLSRRALGSLGKVGPCQI